jgi:hypothetical protein
VFKAVLRALKSEIQNEKTLPLVTTLNEVTITRENDTAIVEY